MAAEPRVPRRRKFLAIIDEEGCTGCRICIDFCPVDCIVYIEGPDAPGINPTCRVVEEACIGCKLCARECPWDAIAILDLQGPAGSPAAGATPPGGETEDRESETARDPV